MALWGPLFLVYWKRHQTGLKILWDNLYKSDHKLEAIRKEFVGESKLNHVTGKIEPDYPHSKRQMRYFESVLIQMVITVTIVFPYLIICFNFTGVITEKD